MIWVASLLWVTIAAAGPIGIATTVGPVAIHFERDELSLRVLAASNLVAVYRFADPPAPTFHPVIGPTGTNVLREYPFAQVPGESRDHPHHRGIWLAHGDVNGHDFWSSRHGERIVPVAFLELNDRTGRFVTSNHWVAAGQLIAADTRAWSILALGDGSLLLDLVWRLYAADRDIVLGDTKEGTFALRLATALQCDPPGSGTLINSEGDSGTAAWGRRARWCRASGRHGGNEISVLLFDHPANPGHPNGWHIRTYGLLAANPFARKSFGLEEAAAAFRIAAGHAVVFRWRVALLPGRATPADIEAMWRMWAGGQPSERGGATQTEGVQCDLGTRATQ